MTANIFPIVTCAASMAFLAWTVATRAETVEGDPSVPRGLVAELQNCLSIVTDGKRLGCYDDVARRNAPPTYQGKLGFRTRPFSINSPHVLRFRSEGVIFVLYVFDENGEVIQNLHIGGGGEDSYLIEKPGIYSLQIDGSARWQIWIEPVRD